MSRSPATKLRERMPDRQHTPMAFAEWRDEGRHNACEADRCAPVRIRSAFPAREFRPTKGGRYMNNHPFWPRWHYLCVALLVATIPDIARSSQSRSAISADRQIQLVASSEKGALLFQNRCATCHATQD